MEFSFYSSGIPSTVREYFLFMTVLVAAEATVMLGYIVIDILQHVFYVLTCKKDIADYSLMKTLMAEDAWRHGFKGKGFCFYALAVAALTVINAVFKGLG